jgi:hypothetical protein
MRLQAFAFKSGFAEPKTLAFAAMPLGNNFMKSFLDKGFKGRLLLMGDFARFFEKAIRYLYGCLHMANHITSYMRMSRDLFVHHDLRLRTP